MNDRPAQLMSHFGELKKRLYIAIAAILVTTILAFAFYKPIQDFVQRPAIEALERVYGPTTRRAWCNSTSQRVGRSQPRCRCWWGLQPRFRSCFIR